MRTLLLFLIFVGTTATASSIRTSAELEDDSYALTPAAGVGYTYVTLKNPNGSKALYDGVGLRASLDIPVLDTESFDILFTPTLKYLDLSNTANSQRQFESANIFGPGLGLAFNWSHIWFGANYFQLWGRHAATGNFSDRTKYSLQSLEYFGGLHWQFNQLGLGIIYSQGTGKISEKDTHLNSSTPYDESMISLQITFSLGKSTWEVIQSLF
jgi:hypothetical protein